jgi:glutathione S-transferase
MLPPRVILLGMSGRIATMKLYEFKGAPNPRRVSIYLAEKGIEVPREQVAMLQGAHRTEQFRAKNAMRQLPILELDDGTCISESIAICRYFEELQPEPPLFGRGPVGKATVEMWNRRVELGLMMSVGNVWIHGAKFTAALGQQLPEVAALHRKGFARQCAFLDRSLADQEFFAGESYSVADISAQVWLDFGTSDLVGLELNADHRHLTRWREQVAQRPSARA